LKLSGEKYRALVKDQRGLGPALGRLGLQAATLPYSWVVRLRNRLYDCGWKRIVRAQVPVVSIGNLTLGGTGKTPCVEYVARYFLEHSRRVVVLSRGYGNSGDSNDEALVLQENLPDVPHLQGPDRVTLAATAEKRSAEVLVLDDGFQHRRLARDLDLLLLDATDSWGLKHLFPRGWLREPLTGLRRASMVILTRCNQVDADERGRLREIVARFAPQLQIIETSHRPVELVNGDRLTVDLDRLAGSPVAAFCAIGNPEAFRQTLAGLGATVVAWRTFPDHHRYSGQDVYELQEWASGQPAQCLMVTTQKDLVKIRRTHLDGKELWAVRVRFTVESGEQELHGMLDQVMSHKEPRTKFQIPSGCGS
jgi:tetraacyldisaccharide 4'-kinase